MLKIWVFYRHRYQSITVFYSVDIAVNTKRGELITTLQMLVASKLMLMNQLIISTNLIQLAEIQMRQLSFCGVVNQLLLAHLRVLVSWLTNNFRDKKWKFNSKKKSCQTSGNVRLFQEQRKKFNGFVALPSTLNQPQANSSRLIRLI